MMVRVLIPKPYRPMLDRLNYLKEGRATQCTTIKARNVVTVVERIFSTILRNLKAKKIRRKITIVN